MKITIKELNSYSRELSIDLEWSEIEKDFEKSTARFSKKIKMPGFRPGKVPKKVLMDRFQPAIESEFVESSVNQYYLQALEEKEITPVNKGSVSDIDFNYGQQFKFKVSFEVEPLVVLPKLKRKSFKIEQTEYITDDKDVEIAIEEVRFRNAEIKTIEDGAQVDDFIICDLQEIDASGVPIIGEKLETRYVKIGQHPFDGLNSEKLTNAKPNQKVKVEVPRDEKGTLAMYELLVKNVERQILPDLNNEFVQRVDPESKDLEEYNNKVKLQLDKAYQEKAEESFNQQLCDKMIEKVNPEFPDSMAESYLHHMVEEVMSKNQGQLEKEKVVETYKPIAEQSLKWYLIRKAIINDQSFKVSKEEISELIDEKKNENPQQKKEIDKFYKKPSNRDRVEDNLLEKKILAYLKEFAKIKQVKVQTKDLRKQSEVNN
ncbi:MAG: trigger factor [Candidatus Neomarinimicrobiota bacterium]